MSVKNAILEVPLEQGDELKNLIVEYVGQQVQPENDEVTLEMVIECLAAEFKELVLAMAEENWVRGYHQAMEDMTEGEKLYKAEQEKNEQRKSD
tara:strand:- start:232 stop:513 length:282 start_codon:yes stop_codon:yes gene_type:complete